MCSSNLKKKTFCRTADFGPATKFQKKYFYKYNTTLNGMLKKHKIDANEFLEFVHDIDIDFL